MVPDKFNMVDMEGIDIITSQGEEIPGLYQKLVESIAQCRYQCLYNWKFDGILIPPTYVEMVATDEEVTICLHDDATGIASPLCETETGAIYNIAGQRLSKMQKGINIVKNRKVLR